MDECAYVFNASPVRFTTNLRPAQIKIIWQDYIAIPNRPKIGFIPDGHRPFTYRRLEVLRFFAEADSLPVHVELFSANN